MMVNHDVTDRMENIPDEKFKIIGIDKDAEAPSRPRIGFWYSSLYSDLQSADMSLSRLMLTRLIKDRAPSTGSARTIWEETCSPEYGRRDVYQLLSVFWAR